MVPRFLTLKWRKFPRPHSCKRMPHHKLMSPTSCSIDFWLCMPRFSFFLSFFFNKSVSSLQKHPKMVFASLNKYILERFMGFPGGSVIKNPPAHAGDMCLIPGLGRSPGGGHGNPLKYSCLENPRGQRSLVGYSLWGHKEWDTAKWLSTTYQGTQFISSPGLRFSPFWSQNQFSPHHHVYMCVDICRV